MNHWLISHRDFNLASVRLRETLFTLGNGYFATRGAHEDDTANRHYPGTYLGGVYNRLTSEVAGKILVNEDLVNLPNWLPITFKIEGEDWFDITQVELLTYRETLQLKRGVVTRLIKFKDKKDRIFTLKSMRFVSQHNPHLAGIRYSISAQNWCGTIIIRSSIKGDVCNDGVPRYGELNKQHLKIINKGAFENKYLYLQAKTTNSHIEISEVIKTEIYRQKSKLTADYTLIEEDKNIHQCFRVNIIPHEKIHVVKIVSIYHSKDHAICENLYDAKKLITAVGSFNELLKHHMRAWKHLWYQSDVEIDCTGNEQQLVRLHLFHTLQSVSKHSVTLDYGIPARGLHGEAYRGHIFWDEIFILPFYFFHYPEIARSMLMYRYYRLPAAKILAKEHGYKGAMFPWQSASNGEEETQKFHLNPRSATWGPDFSSQQRHVNLAIIYNIWNYYQITQDLGFLIEYGAELILEIAKFLNSLVSFDATKNRYEISGVMGPDEYHERYPNAAVAGLNNNSYTNIMTVWALEKALELTKILSKNQVQHLCEALEINREELARWQQITLKMYLPFHEQVISQFEGYEHLKEFNWTAYEKKYHHLERLDRILKAEDTDPNQYQIAKQPDTLMLYFLFEESEIKRILQQLGYKYEDEIHNRTIQYYLKRTSHGSTLSKITCASLLFNHEPNKAEQLYKEALISDLQDTQGGTTEEGIHLGVMVGTTSLLFKNLSGLKIKEGRLSLDPQLPHWISRLKFRLFFRQNLYEIEIFPQALQVTLIENYTLNAPIMVQNKVINLFLNETTKIAYRKQPLPTEKLSAYEPTQ